MTSFLDNFVFEEPLLEVLSPGLSTTVQDLRPRGQGDGIPWGGSADMISSAYANMLVGNDPETEVLEVTALYVCSNDRVNSLRGPSIKLSVDCIMAVTGAECTVEIDMQPASMNAPLGVKGGSVVTLGPIRGPGLRVYIALGGGLPGIASYCGSKSTFVNGSIGGHQVSETIDNTC